LLTDDTAIKSITGNDNITSTLEPAYKKYNEDQFTTVKVPGSSQSVIVSEFNRLDDGRYFDIESRTSWEFDHTTQVCGGLFTGTGLASMILSTDFER
jgi:capping protein alpha